MSFIVKVVLPRTPGTRDIARDALIVSTRTKVLGAFEPYPEIVHQIEGSDRAYFEAEWENGQARHL